MKNYHKCEFCDAEGPDVDLVPFRSVIVAMCTNCKREEYDSVYGPGAFDKLGKKEIIDTTLVPFPPVTPEAIQKPNMEQSLLRCNCGYWGNCECEASASLWDLERTLDSTKS